MEHTSFQVTLAELVHQKRKVIAIPFDFSIRETLAVMNKENLICVPIYGSPGKWISCGGFNVVVQGCQYIGVLTLADLLVFMLNDDSGYLDTDVAARMEKVTAVEALGATQESQTLWVEPAHRPLTYSMERFAKGVHYLLVHDEQTADRDLKILSQTDVIKYLHTNASTCPVIKVTLARPVGHFACTSVESVSVSTSMLVALGLLRSVRAVPVLSRDGELVSTLSLSDLRGYYRHPTDFTKLVGGVTKMTTVGEYLSACHGGRMREPVSVGALEPLSSAVQKMVERRVHRVWIRQEPTKFRDALAGVVSMTDVIRAVYEADQKCLSESFHPAPPLPPLSQSKNEQLESTDDDNVTTKMEATATTNASDGSTCSKCPGPGSLERSHQNFDVCMTGPEEEGDEESKRVL